MEEEQYETSVREDKLQGDEQPQQDDEDSEQEDEQHSEIEDEQHSEQEDELDDEELERLLDEEERKEGGFVIYENIDNTNQYHELHKRIGERQELQKAKRRVPNHLLEMDLPVEQYAQMKVKFVKPFDYELMRKRQESRGVIFVQKPIVIGSSNDSRLRNIPTVRNYFAQFGTITRVQPAVEGSDRKIIVGWHIEYESKSVAKRVALSANGASISPQDSRTLSVKYVPKFKWSEHVEKDERHGMYKKMLRAEAEKELRTLREYKQNKQLSSMIKTGKISKPKSMFKFRQRAVNKVSDQGGAHVQALSIL